VIDVTSLGEALAVNVDWANSLSVEGAVREQRLRFRPEAASRARES